ncbi:MAG: methyl-accepting chemotaxis protein [Mariprofundaceae bacterium]|nr:methyl-accepting chemotaxis protein [Mariprofundaceae bacterium]
MLQYFLNLPIRMKLLLPTLVMVLGFLIAAASYWQGLQKIADSEQYQQDLNALSKTMMNLTLNVSYALQHEKDFLWRKDLRYLNMHQQDVKKIIATIQSIQKQSDSLQLSLDTHSLQSLTETYQQKFSKLLDNTFIIGLNEHSGLRGKIRNTIHAVEAEIDQSHQLDLRNSMLQMRRHEKDFLARKQLVYINQMKQEYDIFDALLQKSKLSPKQKKDIDEKMNAYEKGFETLSQAVLQEQALIKALRDEIVKVNPLLSRFHQQLNTSLNNANNLSQRLKEQQQQQFFSVLFVLALTMAIILWLISKSITKPLDQLLGLVHDLAQNGNLNQRLTVTGNHELADLAMSINQLMDHLSMMVLEVEQSSQKIITSSQQLLASIRDQSATVREQAVTTQQMAASSREISMTAETVQDNMESVTDLARNTNQSASEGQKSLITLEQALHHMMDASHVISEKFGMLNEKAANIGQVITTITKVADQTNLLSLNAAIEAEKAGEYGRGFSVVAAEIRRLANQSAVTTLEIEGIVKDMQSAVSEGVMGMDKFSDEIRSGVEIGEDVNIQLQEIIREVLELTPCIESANEGLRNQVMGSKEISTAIEQLQVTTQQTQDMVIQTNQVIEGLNQASKSLSDGMSQFSTKVI